LHDEIDQMHRYECQPAIHYDRLVDHMLKNFRTRVGKLWSTWPVLRRYWNVAIVFGINFSATKLQLLQERGRLCFARFSTAREALRTLGSARLFEPGLPSRT